jgi:polysaccharide biosynthesis protein PelE
MRSFLVAFVVLAAAVVQLEAVVLGVGATEVPNAAVGLYLLGGFGGAAALLFAVTPQNRRPRLPDAVLISGFSVFFPVFGLPGLAAMLAVRSRSPVERRRTGLRETMAPSLPGSPLNTDVERRYGPGALEGILRHSADPEARLKVVLACRSLPDRASVQLLRMALRDPVDDVRLLAYAVLERRERDIQTQIQDLLAGAGQSSSGVSSVSGTGEVQLRPQLPPATHGRLAELYWELVYCGLVEGELLAFSLEQVLWHSAEVRRHRSASPRMALLAGRALLMMDRAAEARGLLEESIRRGLPVEVVGPYLAEADYRDRHPRHVRQQVAVFAKSARLRPGLAGIVEQWS